MFAFLFLACKRLSVCNQCQFECWILIIISRLHFVTLATHKRVKRTQNRIEHRPQWRRRRRRTEFRILEFYYFTYRCLVGFLLVSVRGIRAQRIKRNKHFLFKGIFLFLLLSDIENVSHAAYITFLIEAQTALKNKTKDNVTLYQFTKIKIHSNWMAWCVVCVCESLFNLPRIFDQLSARRLGC